MVKALQQSDGVDTMQDQLLSPIPSKSKVCVECMRGRITCFAGLGHKTGMRNDYVMASVNTRIYMVLMENTGVDVPFV